MYPIAPLSASHHCSHEVTCVVEKQEKYYKPEMFELFFLFFFFFIFFF